MLHQQVLNLQFQPSKRCNLTPVVSSALMDLQKRDNIVVKPANNVGAIVVWDRNPHIKEAYKHPDNPMNFQKCLIKKKDILNILFTSAPSRLSSSLLPSSFIIYPSSCT